MEAWLAALDTRHLADLTPTEVARALRALSSCYVERRGKLARGGALDSAGKRAAFALFYAPLHHLVVREIVSSLPPEARGVRTLLDLGCGTGAAGAAWAVAAGATQISGTDRNPWAVAEARWTYGQFGLAGRAAQGDIGRLRLRGEEGLGVLLAYAVNELPDAVRPPLLEDVLRAAERGARILLVEPIARRMSGWWDDWARAFAAAGGRADEWRFDVPLPERQRALARAAGLDPRQLTARSLWL
jgi:SAM-dependent methyltransferase